MNEVQDVTQRGVKKPVLGIVGASGMGKTTLITALLSLLAARGLRVSVIKHTHHFVEMDTVGKDSWRHRQAGAQEVMLLSERQVAVWADVATALTLDEQIARLQPVDLVLLEGQKWQAVPKLEVYRPQLAASLQCEQDPQCLAVVSDAVWPLVRPLLPLNNPECVCDFIYQWWEQQI